MTNLFDLVPLHRCIAHRTVHCAAACMVPIGVYLHWLGHQHQVHLPLPDRGHFPTFWEVSPCCAVPIRSTGTKVHCEPIKNLRTGPIPMALQLRETSTTSPSMALIMSTSTRRSPEPKAIHHRQRRLWIEYNHKLYGMNFYFTLRPGVGSRQSLNPLRPNPTSANPSWSTPLRFNNGIRARLGFRLARVLQISRII
jgi:hypothetical protein